MAHKKSSKRTRTSVKLSAIFYKELFMALLAVLSVFFVFYEYIVPTNETAHFYIMRFDIIVALIFLTDFIVALVSAKDKAHYLKHNWYLLVASIPIIDGWAELLRGLRLLELVRLVRAGSHVTYAYSAVKARR